MKKIKSCLPYSFFKKGFTMIEMLVVVTIIAVITSIGLVSYRNSTISARNAKRKQDLEIVKQALLIYRMDNGSYPTALLDVDMSIAYIHKKGEQSKEQKFSFVPQAYAIDCGSYTTFATCEAAVGCRWVEGQTLGVSTDEPQQIAIEIPGDGECVTDLVPETPVPNTPTPIATNTPVPTATNTPVPAATNTPVPAATSTPVPQPTAPAGGVDEEDVARFNTIVGDLSTDGYLDTATLVDPKNEGNYQYQYVSDGSTFSLCCNLEPDGEGYCIYNP